MAVNLRSIVGDDQASSLTRKQSTDTVERTREGKENQKKNLEHYFKCPY